MGAWETPPESRPWELEATMSWCYHRPIYLFLLILFKMIKYKL